MTSGGPIGRLTDAVLPVRSELKAGVADALEAPFRVDAAAVAAHHPVDNTLVDVCRGQRTKSGVTATRLEGRSTAQRDVPMQACLVGVPWYPSWHLQWYDPGVLTQSPLIQGLLTHSSTSGKERGEIRTPQQAALSLHWVGS